LLPLALSRYECWIPEVPLRPATAVLRYEQTLALPPLLEGDTYEFSYYHNCGLWVPLGEGELLRLIITFHPHPVWGVEYLPDAGLRIALWRYDREPADPFHTVALYDEWCLFPPFQRRVQVIGEPVEPGAMWRLSATVFHQTPEGLSGGFPYSYDNRPPDDWLFYRIERWA